MICDDNGIAYTVLASWYSCRVVCCVVSRHSCRVISVQPSCSGIAQGILSELDHV